MTKKEYAKEIMAEVERVMEQALLDSMNSRYIFTFRLMDRYSDEDIFGCAKWVKPQKIRTMSGIFFAMPHYLDEKKSKELKERWKYD